MSGQTLARRPFKRDAPDVQLLEVCGHSYAAGGGAYMSWASGYDVKLAKLLGAATFRKLAVGGAQAIRPTKAGSGDGGYPHILQNVYRMNPAIGGGFQYLPASQVVVAHFDINDLAAVGSQKLVAFKNAYRAILSRFCSCAVWEDTDPQWSMTGAGWAALAGTGQNSGSQLRYTTTIGESATFTLPASYPGGLVVGVGLFINVNTQAVIGVKVDGVDRPDVTIDGPGWTDTVSATNLHGHHVLRFTGLAAGQHTIQLTLKSGASPMLAVDYAFCEADPKDGPVIIAPAAIKPFTYALWAGFTKGPNAGSDPLNDAALAAVNQAKQDVHAEFGQPIFVVDVDPISRGSRDHWYTGDDAHPSTLLHGVLARKIAEVVRAKMTPRVAERLQHDPRNAAFWQPIGLLNGPAFQNGWSNLATGYYDAAFKYDPNTNRVHFRGLIKGGTVPPIQVFQMPASLRPLKTLAFDVNSNNAVGRVEVGNDGWVRVQLGNVAFVSLDGLSYEVES